MKIEDHIRKMENADAERKPAADKVRPLFLMLTYERPGFLKNAVESFVRTVPGAKLVVFDDGSKSVEKLAELDAVGLMGCEVLRERHEGFLGSWARMMALATQRADGHDSVVVVEDDVVFSTAWLDVLAHMMVGASAAFMPGMMSCFRHYSDDDWGERVVLDGVEAVGSRFNSTSSNILPIGVAAESGAFEKAVDRHRRCGGQCDVIMAEELSRLGVEHFVTVRSYVLHVGYRNSAVRKQGIPSFPFPGIKLINELEVLRKIRDDSR